MKKQIKLTAASLTLCLTLCSCQNTADISTPTSSTQEVSNPFDNIPSDDVSVIYEDAEIQKYIEKQREVYGAVYELSTDVYEDKIEWIDDETMKLPLKLEGRGEKPETEFCPIVCCDGILAQTSMDGENFGYSECRIKFVEKTDMAENITHEIYVRPIFDSSIKTHYISLAYIQNPDERPDDYWTCGEFLNKGHSISCSPIEVPEEHSSLIKDIDPSSVLAAKPSVSLTNEYKNIYLGDQEFRLDLFDPEGTKTFSEEPHHQSNVMVKQGSDEAKLTVVATTTTPCSIPYKVIFLVNNKQVKFNGNYDTLTLTLEGGKISMTDVTIKLKDKDTVCALFLPMPEVFNDSATHRMTGVHLVEEVE